MFITFLLVLFGVINLFIVEKCLKVNKIVVFVTNACLFVVFAPKIKPCNLGRNVEM